jgi:TrkA domain protein
MTQVQQTPLPGVGIRYDFTTGEGIRVGVVHHHAGRREMFVCLPYDPDTAAVRLTLSDEEAHSLIEVLGGTRVTENLARLRQQVEGLALDWLTLEPGSPYAGKTIGDARIRTRTGVSVIAVLRGEQAHPAPGPEFRMEESDVLVVVGTPDGIGTVDALLRAG